MIDLSFTTIVAEFQTILVSKTSFSQDDNFFKTGKSGELRYSVSTLRGLKTFHELTELKSNFPTTTSRPVTGTGGGMDEEATLGMGLGCEGAVW